MPGELLPTIITSLLSRTENGFPFKSDQTSLLVSFVLLQYEEINVFLFSLCLRARSGDRILCNS